MNKIVLILPNTFGSKQDFKDLRKQIIDNYRAENIISLPTHTFQPHVAVNTLILHLTTNQPTDYFWKFKVNNDGYTQNKRRQKKEGENDFDIF
jgi:type I restriction enzyme M protein